MKNLPIPRIVSKLLKVSFLFLVATSVLSSSAQAGLKLYWNLNENTGTSAGDSSGNSNVGTFPLPPYNGSAPIIWGPGIEGSGALVRGYPYAYNGITASNSSNQIFTSGNGAFALAMAILPTAGPTSTTMYPLATTGLAGPQVHGFRLGVDYTYNYFTSDHWEARLKFWSTEGGGTVSLLSSTLLVKYAWSQIAVIYDGATAKSSINGTLVGQQTGTITNGTETFKVGGGFNSRIFDGTIDEVRVWQGAVNPGEIFQLPRLYWNLNENTGTTAGDSSGNGNIGTFPLPPYNGAQPIIWGPGWEGSGALVRGYPYAYNGITAPNSSNQIFTSGNGSFSMAMWISPSANPFSNTLYPLATNELTSTRGFRLGVDYTINPSYQWERRLKFWSTDSGGTVSLLSSTQLTQYEWSQIAVTYDGTTAKMYINGLLDSQQNGTITNGTETFKVGGGFNSRIFDRSEE